MDDLNSDLRPETSNPTDQSPARPTDAITDGIGQTPMAASAVPVELAVVEDEASVVYSNPPRPFRGPGIWGAAAWMLTFLVIQLGASLLVMVVLAASFFLNTDLSTLTEQEIRSYVTDMAIDPRNMTALICGTLCVSAILNSLMIWWRLGTSGRSTLGLRRLPVGQAVCIMLMVLPLSMIGSKLYLVGEVSWQELISQFPHGFDLSSLKSMDTIAVMSNELSLPWMMFLFALLPAVSEELMFRGFIGRGLTERWGRVTGVLLTTWFFAMMHGYPPHMLALIPLSIMIHDVYLVTKSFWAPVLMHFTNNALAVIVLSLHVDDPVLNAQSNVDISPPMIFASLSCVLALAALIRALQRQPGLHTGSVPRLIGNLEESGEHAVTSHGHIATMQNHVSLQLDALTQTALEHIRIKRLLALATISVMLFGIACFNFAAV